MKCDSTTGVLSVEALRLICETHNKKCAYHEESARYYQAEVNRLEQIIKSYTETTETPVTPYQLTEV